MQSSSFNPQSHFLVPCDSSLFDIIQCVTPRVGLNDAAEGVDSSRDSVMVAERRAEDSVVTARTGQYAAKVEAELQQISDDICEKMMIEFYSRM